MSPEVDLSAFDSASFDRGASRAKEVSWLLVSLLLFRLCPVNLSAIKRVVLRLFGARVGSGVVIKPDVRITFPWRLSLGNHVWIGEGAWLLNLAPIALEDDVCISQRAFLCTGSHDYKSPTFDLVTKPIIVERGAWVAAAAWVGPGVTIGQHAVLGAGSVAGRDLDAFHVYRGNPAVSVRRRVLGSSSG